MGTVVKRPKKMVVFHPPPIFHAKYVGTPAIREIRTRLEKLSLPAPSAGRGAFLMEGYYHRTLADAQLMFAEAVGYCKRHVRSCEHVRRRIEEQHGGTHRGGLYSTVLKLFECGRWSFWGFDEFKFALGAIDALRFGHDCCPSGRNVEKDSQQFRLR
jgi:hypothetical protein